MHDDPESRGSHSPPHQKDTASCQNKKIRTKAIRVPGGGDHRQKKKKTGTHTPARHTNESLAAVTPDAPHSRPGGREDEPAELDARDHGRQPPTTPRQRNHPLRIADRWRPAGTLC